MKRIIINILCVILSSISLFSQAHWGKAVQFLTPNAEILGKYGQVPVSYFNGLPQISIPISIFRVNGYELPISLSYYASGNKPDSHPGWVGLGWNLSAGGAITRIINGIKDEMTETERRFTINSGNGFSTNPGYYYRTDSVNRTNWSNKNYLYYIKSMKTTSRYPYDTEPDEFVVNIAGISASFFLTGNNTVKIKSKSNDNFKINVSLDTKSSYTLYNSGDANLNANCFTYINEIILTNKDGIKYYFGGDMTTIEFAFNMSSSGFIGTANTWHLKKILIPNGEIIVFNYQKDGIPIVEHNNHSLHACYENNTPIGEPYNTRNISDGNYSYTFIQPSYLTSIQSSISARTMSFKRSRSAELDYNINSSIFSQKVINVDIVTIDNGYHYADFAEQNYYMQLDTIIDNESAIGFSYTNSSNTRLKLENITFDDNQSSLVKQYFFEYNPMSLPSYNSKRTDNWGFYNNKYYDSIDYRDLYAFRTADTSYIKAEILTKMIYPTGGSSQFIYESHDFSKVAKQFPFEIIDSIGICGGVRIKKIINNDANNNINVREFEYLNKNGVSSGILSGIPIYYSEGKQYVKYNFSQWFGWVYYHANEDYIYHYVIGNQQVLNQLANTDGSHITYSSVTEKLSDGSKTVYYYSNHDGFPDEEPVEVLHDFDKKLPLNKFISKELERGLLDSVQYYNGNLLVKKELYTYNSNPYRYNDYVKSINTFLLYSMIRLSALKYYTFWPYLESKKEVYYYSTGTVTTQYKYKYNLYKFLSEEEIVNSDGTVYLSHYQYYLDKYFPQGIQNDPIGVKIRDSHMLHALHRESLFKQEAEGAISHLVKSIRTDYDVFYNIIKPSSIYTLNLDSPIEPSPVQSELWNYDYQKDIEFKYDSKGNVLETITKDGLTTAYIWSYKHQHPIAEIKNASFDEVSTALTGTTPDLLANSIIPDMQKVEALRQHPDLSNAQITTYTYKPLVCMTSKTDPRGVATYYEYDTFNRLKRTYIKENGVEKTIQTYDYHYKQ